MVCRRVVWAQLDCPFELPLARIEVPVVVDHGKTEGGVRLREGIIDLQRLYCIFFRQPSGLIGRHPAVVRENQVTVCHPRVRPRKARVDLCGLLEVLQGLPGSFLHPLVPVEATLQVERESLGVGRCLLLDAQLLLGEKLNLQRLGHLLRDFTLDGEDVCQFSVIALSPDVPVVRDFYQLRGYPDRVPRLSNARFEYGPHPEFPAYLSDWNRGIPVLHYRGSRDDAELPYLRHRGYQLLSHPVCEVPVVGVWAHVR